MCPFFQRDTYSATQRSTCCCSHCARAISATVRFTVRYSINIALLSGKITIRVLSTGGGGKLPPKVLLKKITAILNKDLF